MSSLSSLPLSPFEAKARIHAHIAFFAFLVALPLGVLIPRYLRTFTSAWFWPHAAMNLLVTGPLVFTAFALGYQTTTASGLPHFRDPHQKAGLALLILYCIQVSLGAFIHFVKLPRTFPGGRRPQNYLHAVLGLAIIGLAAFQTHYGLWTEWAFVTGNAHPVTWHCKRFWLGIVVVRSFSRFRFRSFFVLFLVTLWCGFVLWRLHVPASSFIPSLLLPASSFLLVLFCFVVSLCFRPPPPVRLIFTEKSTHPSSISHLTNTTKQGMFTLYALGLALLPRQFKQERAARRAAVAGEKAGSLEGLKAQDRDREGVREA
ncbi:hypothetical protein B0H11DRAFT_1733104 [Mycena galericulata]|nr:hypothetical protein B0H11DRAFT_1733104 [Mycena galericulata]